MSLNRRREMALRLWIAALLLAPLTPTQAAIQPIIMHLRANPDFADRITQQVSFLNEAVRGMSATQLQMPKMPAALPGSTPAQISDLLTAQSFTREFLAWSSELEPQHLEELGNVMSPEVIGQIDELNRLIRENPKSKLTRSLAGLRKAGTLFQATNVEGIEAALAQFWDQAHVQAGGLPDPNVRVTAPEPIESRATTRKSSGKKFEFGEKERADAREKIQARPLMTAVQLAEFVADKAYVKKGMGSDGAMLETRGVIFPAGVYRPEYDAMLSVMGFHTWRIKSPDRAEIFGLGIAPRPEWYRWVGPADYPFETWMHGNEKRIVAEPGEDGQAIVLSNVMGRETKRRFVPGPDSENRRKMQKEIRDSMGTLFQIGPLTAELFDQWYGLYEKHVVSKPGGERLVQPDRMRKEAERMRREKGPTVRPESLGKESKTRFSAIIQNMTDGLYRWYRSITGRPMTGEEMYGPLTGWWGIFFFDPKITSQMVGGMIMKDWPERNQLTGHFAAYADKASGLSERAFMEGLNLAHYLQRPVWSLGEDWNERGLGRPISLMSNKAAKGLIPVPDDQLEIVGHIDMSPFGKIKDEKGWWPGLLFFEIRTDTREGIKLIRRYLAALEAGTFTTLGDVLGYDYFATNHPQAQQLMRLRRYTDDPDSKVSVPNGFDVVSSPLVRPGRVDVEDKK